MPQNGMYAPPRLLPNIKGGAYIAVFCDVCDEGFQAREHSKPEIAHMPQNGMYAPPGDGPVMSLAANAPPGLLPIIAGGGRVGEVPMPRHDCLSPRRTGRAGFPHPALAETLAANMHRPPPSAPITGRSSPEASSGHRPSCRSGAGKAAGCDAAGVSRGATARSR